MYDQNFYGGGGWGKGNTERGLKRGDVGLGPLRNPSKHILK